MTLEECKLVFFIVVAAAAHETSLSQSDQAETLCWTLTSHTSHSQKYEATLVVEPFISVSFFSLAVFLPLSPPPSVLEAQR